MERLRALRKEIRRTQQQMADFLGISQQAYATYENNRAQPPIDIMQKLATFFDVSIDYLLGRTETPRLYDSNGIACPEPTTDHSRWVPVYGAIAAGVPIDAIEDIEDFEEIDTDKISGEVFCLRVKGHSMEPRICDGDVVVIRKQPNIENGEIAAVMVNGDEATLKKVKIDKNGIMLIPLNPAYETMYYTGEEVQDKPVRILGKMVELRGKF